MIYPRDLKGYGRDVPYADWPGSARISVQFVLNYEEGAERSVQHGALRAFLVVQDELNSDSRAAGPVGIGDVTAVTLQIARIDHRSIPSTRMVARPEAGRAGTARPIARKNSLRRHCARV